ncbi:MAG: hypothetical protein ACK5MT_18555 [Actinomycetales bacterium]
MADVLKMQGDDPESPDEEKRSNPSYVFCAGVNNSNTSKWFC